MAGEATTGIALVGQIEALLVEAAARITPPARVGPGRPPILPAAVLWASLTLGVLRQAASQRDVWRLALAQDRWPGERIVVSDEAVYRRLATADPQAMGTLFSLFTEALVARTDPAAHQGLAPFAADVVVLDETTLDQVARWGPELRGVPPGSDRLLPGTVAGVFDLRRQLWRTVELRADPHQNEKVAARALLATLTPGSLVLADLGYFGFPWFDTLTAAGHHWISRCRAKTSYRTAHVHYQDATTLDALIWLGAHRSDQAKHLVRLVRFHDGTAERTYLTSVRDPRVLPLREIARLYARRWDIELAVKLVKRELGLALLWSAKPAVIWQQVWATLLIAQLLQALRQEIAVRAAVDPFEVSMALLVRHFPGYARFPDPIAAFVADGRLMGFIRPSTRLSIRAPVIPLDHLTLPPHDLVTERAPRSAGRKCGPNRTNLRK